MNKRAQGALEYLLLIGGAILIAAVVITLLTGLGGGGSGYGKCANVKYQSKFQQLLVSGTGKVMFDGEGIGEWKKYAGGPSFPPYIYQNPDTCNKSIKLDGSKDDGHGYRTPATGTWNETEYSKIQLDVKSPVDFTIYIQVNNFGGVIEYRAINGTHVLPTDPFYLGYDMSNTWKTYTLDFKANYEEVGSFQSITSFDVRTLGSTQIDNIILIK